MAQSTSAKWRFWIDRGGTFTDIVAQAPDGELIIEKLLSEDPANYADAAIEGIGRILKTDHGAPIPADQIDHVKMGTTVATNALLERKGAPVLFVTNRGFSDLLQIGDQSRPKLFELDIQKPTPIYEDTLEISGRVDVDGQEIEALDEAAARAEFAKAAQSGMTSCAIALINAWRWPQMEQRLSALAREAGFTNVSASHAVSGLIGLVPRASSTLVDAYLSPVLSAYVARVAAALPGVDLYFMKSSGDLTRAEAFRGKDAVLSGPAGGLIASAKTAKTAGEPNIITFDMGGTSTDVAFFDGSFERTDDAALAGVKLRSPIMSINTVAAGGGSVLSFDGEKFAVGPESAGADPGPMCYRRGGPLTVTDANLFLGRLDPSQFPKIFGPNRNETLDTTSVKAAFAALGAQARMAPEEVAQGFVDIAVANMARAIRQVTLEKGRDIDGFALNCFGGAGGQLACRVASELGVKRVLVHPLSGVLSAYGMGLADRGDIDQIMIEEPLHEASLVRATAMARELENAQRTRLIETGARPDALTSMHVLHLKYRGSDTTLALCFKDAAALEVEFHKAHLARFGFSRMDREIIVEKIAIETIEPGGDLTSPSEDRKKTQTEKIGDISFFADGHRADAHVFARDDLAADARICGPALIVDRTATIVVDADWEARVLKGGEVLLSLCREVPGDEVALAQGHKAAPVRLELFANMFMGLAEQMGSVLKNTAASVNMKERLDFSCAIFDRHGALIANAPHVPVHLGAMGQSVRHVLSVRGDELRPGDMIALNNPGAGGTHLPDITVIAPVHDMEGKELLFFVANRGHHADIGGIAPGSAPPFSKTLAQEGVVIDDFLLVRNGDLREADFRELLQACAFPARNPDENVADIAAQVAANNAGVRALHELVRRYGADTLNREMQAIVSYAEERVRKAIDVLSDGSFQLDLENGGKICVAVHVDHHQRRALIDFSGTSEQSWDNFNAPSAVARAAVLYVFRCLVGDDMPLNEGCLAPIDIRIPEGSLLAPDPDRAVVAGNTEISQAICNVLFGALGVRAGAQGTMNNLLLGDATRQYYETICGGAGAGPDFQGASAVHTDMTNTRITDPELMEFRYPFRVEAFSIRRGSGGAGVNRGGDGVVRKIRVCAPQTLSFVSSSRRSGPHGLSGGGMGAVGRQWVERPSGERVEFAGVDGLEVSAGDLIVIETPGGGAWGHG